MTILSDASPIIALDNIGELLLLQKAYGEILITDIVAQEVKIALPKWIITTDAYSPSKFKELGETLDPGEASALAYCLENKETVLIIDERKGRKIAKEAGIEIIGLLGVIVKASREGVISTGHEIVDKLIQDGFRISEKIEAIVRNNIGD